MLAQPITCPSAYVIDGDTLRCGQIRLRLLGIDAPELPGHCARYRECAPGDGFSSKRSLIDALRNGASKLQHRHDRSLRALRRHGVVWAGEPVMLAAAARSGDLQAPVGQWRPSRRIVPITAMSRRLNWSAAFFVAIFLLVVAIGQRL